MLKGTEALIPNGSTSNLSFTEKTLGPVERVQTYKVDRKLLTLFICFLNFQYKSIGTHSKKLGFCKMYIVFYFQSLPQSSHGRLLKSGSITWVQEMPRTGVLLKSQRPC